MIMSSTRPVTKRSPSRVDIAGIAGEVPAAVERARVGVGAAPIALERLVARKLGDDLALLARRAARVGLAAAERHDADALVEPRLAGRARLAAASCSMVKV